MKLIILPHKEGVALLSICCVFGSDYIVQVSLAKEQGRIWSRPALKQGGTGIFVRDCLIKVSVTKRSGEDRW